MTREHSLATEIGELIRPWRYTLAELRVPLSEKSVHQAELEIGLNFPPSYREFLRRVGGGKLGDLAIFGMRSDRLWGDVVMLNQLATDDSPKHYLKFAHDRDGYDYFLDTSRMDAAGECPVVLLGPEREEVTAAGSFLAFLRKSCEGYIG